MVALFRQFIVALLVLLQSALPLVHAHTGGTGSQEGFHLYEFETVKVLVDHLSLSAVDHGQQAKNCIINIGSAIKQLPGKASIVDSFLNNYQFASVNTSEILIFLEKPLGLVFKRFSKQTNPRAPPM
jgi:hypothetical protein